ncbi:MAG: response regulator transcription factor [Chloroflexi bacterium]|nr:response regulator transcription factor [Dehalococcoidia bacterium]NJD64070.1 response regulator transcription factor [Chloroflexota bacterium]PWB48866.1 MAG: GlnR family transcriptional regulator [Dehalococcoidia bacterium]
MRTVFLVTRHPDVARLGPELERAGFSAPAITPEQLANDEASPTADVVLLDLRDIPPAAFNILSATYVEEGVILIAMVAGEQLDRVTVDLPIDDFVVLGSPPEELARRIERALWRKHGVDSENYVRCGALAIDLSNYRVTVDDEPLVMTFKEYELLRFLAMNAGRVFTREQLLNRVWGYDYFGGARTVDVHIRRIRAKIEIHGHAFIETVRNVGYRLVPEAKKELAE